MAASTAANSLPSKHQWQQRQISRRSRQCALERQAGESVEESYIGDVFMDIMEKSTIFFDTISTSDSVTVNPFVSANITKVDDTFLDAFNPSVNLNASDARDEASIATSPHALETVDAERQCASPLSTSNYDDSPAINVESVMILKSDLEDISLGLAEQDDEESAVLSIDTSRPDEAYIDHQDMMRDNYNTPSPNASHPFVVEDMSHQSLFDTDSDEIIDEAHDSPDMSVDSIKTMEDDLEEISLGSVDHEEDKEIVDDSGSALPRQHEDDIEQDAMENHHQHESSSAKMKPNVTISLGYQALFDTDSDEIEDMEELQKYIDDVSTLTEDTYSFAPYSSKPFTFPEIQVQQMLEQDEMAPNRRRSLSAEVMYKQRLEEIAARRSLIARIAIAFEDVVMAVCGQEEEVLFLVDEEEVEEREGKIEAAEAKRDNLEKPIHEKAIEENANASIGMAGLLKTIQISSVGKLTTKDRVLVPLYERAVLHLVGLENQVMRKARAIETGKRALASCTRSKETLDAATNIAFLEIELKETKRKVVESREQLQRLYEAFSLKTQKCIDDLQMDGFRYNES